jgi:hypothetical protein
LEADGTPAARAAAGRGPFTPFQPEIVITPLCPLSGVLPSIREIIEGKWFGPKAAVCLGF